MIDGGGSSSDVGRARVVIDGSQGNFPAGMYFGFQTFETLSPHAKINGLEMRNFHLSGSNPNDPEFSQSHAVGAASDSMDVTNSIFDHHDVGSAGAAVVTTTRRYANATGLYVEYGGQGDEQQRHPRQPPRRHLARHRQLGHLDRPQLHRHRRRQPSGPGTRRKRPGHLHEQRVRRSGPVQLGLEQRRGHLHRQ